MNRRRNPAPMAANQAPQLGLSGDLWLTADGRDLGGPARIGLLAAIATHGSITHAAKAVGLSYKAAWDAVATMNNLAGEPLVARTSGGRGGGSTRLTDRGTKLVERYASLATLHQRFVALLAAEGIDLDEDLSILKTLNMKTSARNQYVGTVSALRTGAVNDEIELTLPGGAKLVAIVSRESTEAMALRPDMAAFALIQSSSVLIATDLQGARLSARNQLAGTVLTVTPGAVNSEVVLEIGGGATLVATVTRGSAEGLQLAPGVGATALFKASSVIVGVQA